MIVAPVSVRPTSRAHGRRQRRSEPVVTHTNGSLQSTVSLHVAPRPGLQANRNAVSASTRRRTGDSYHVLSQRR